MRTAFVTFYETYPPESGAATVSYNVARTMPGERLLVQVCGRPGRQEPDPNLAVESLSLPAVSTWQKLVRLNARIRALEKAVVRFGPDMVVLEGASWAVYHWRLLRVLRRRLPGTPIVYHSHNVEYDLRRSRNGRAVAWITRLAEGRLLRNADRAYAVSATDARRLMDLYGVGCDLLPNGVDAGRFDAVKDDEVAAARARHNIGPQALLFIGLYVYPPNTKAVRFLIEQVMPVLHGTHPDAQLVVTGGVVPFHFPWLRNPGVLPFREMPALIRACSVAAAPIFSGSGTRLKILECLAAGTPVVSSAKGAEGLALEDGRSILRAEDGAGFAAQVRRLWDDPLLVGELRNQGRKIVLSMYDWPVCTKPLVDFAATVAGKCPRPPDYPGGD